MSPAPPRELGDVFALIRQLQALGVDRNRILEILLPLEMSPAVSKMGGHIVRHVDIPIPAVSISA